MAEPEPTLSENVLTEDEVRAEAKRQMDEYKKAVEQGQGSRYALAELMAQTDTDEYEVVVDEWGHTPRLVRGQRVTAANCPYDLQDAINRGIVRRMNLAEVRSMTPHPTLPLTGDGLAIDEALIMAGRFHAGFRTPDLTGVISDPSGNPVTITTAPADNRAEPPGQSKPTLPGPDDNTPAGRPVITVQPGQDPRAAVEDYFADQEHQATGRREPAERGVPERSPARK